MAAESGVVLPEPMLEMLSRSPPVLTTVVATIGEDGGPHTAPFGSLRALSPARLRFGCDRTHQTYENILGDERVAVCILAPPDVAGTIFGRARVVKEAMEGIPTDAVLEIAVERVKDDMLPGATILTGTTYRVVDDLEPFLRAYWHEVVEEA